MAPATTTAEMGEAPGSETLKDATIDVRMATGNHNTTQLWRTWDEKVRVQDRSVHVSANSRQKGDLRSRQRVTRERERERESPSCYSFRMYEKPRAYIDMTDTCFAL